MSVCMGMVVTGYRCFWCFRLLCLLGCTANLHNFRILSFFLSPLSVCLSFPLSIQNSPIPSKLPEPIRASEAAARKSQSQSQSKTR